MPLIVIIVVTAVKDGIEDWRRTVLDNELNNAPMHRLVDWQNVNTADEVINPWRKTKKATTRGILWVWQQWKNWKEKKGKNGRMSLKETLGSGSSSRGKGKERDLSGDEDDEWDESFIPTYVYDALKEKKRFDHMRVGPLGYLLSHTQLTCF